LLVFDQVLIAIGNNSNKQRYFPLELMQEKISATFRGETRVSVKVFQGLTAEFARTEDAEFIVRGLRNTTDFEYENSISQANRHVNQELETVFLITTPGLSAITSTIVRDLHRYGASVADFLPYTLP
jgi:pantetheine-phosphate adenylyltransferase